MFRLADPSKVVFGGIILINGRMNGPGTAGR
jgi:hypothetical protein